MDLETPGERLRWARKNKTRYETATDAAKAFGWTVSTYLGHENGDRVPSRKAAKKYGAAYKVPWTWLLEGEPLDGSRSRKVGPIPIRGEVAAGQWLDVDVEVDHRDFEQYPIAAHPDYPFDAQYGLIAKGTSMNKVFPAGVVLHCVDVIKADLETEEGDIVIAQRMRHQGSQREVTAKRISRRGRMIILSPDSTESRWKAIEFDPKDGHEDEEEVRVLALVIGRYTPMKRRRA